MKCYKKRGSHQSDYASEVQHFYAGYVLSRVGVQTTEAAPKPQDTGTKKPAPETPPPSKGGAKGDKGDGKGKKI